MISAINAATPINIITHSKPATTPMIMADWTPGSPGSVATTPGSVVVGLVVIASLVAASGSSSVVILGLSSSVVESFSVVTITVVGSSVVIGGMVVGVGEGVLTTSVRELDMVSVAVFIVLEGTILMVVEGEGVMVEEDSLARKRQEVKSSFPLLFFYHLLKFQNRCNIISSVILFKGWTGVGRTGEGGGGGTRGRCYPLIENLTCQCK